MSSVLTRLISLVKPSGGLMDYEEAKRLAADESARVRQTLAKRRDVQPEILYFLAEDTEPEVRREIAANHATPVQADLILARDDDEDMRCRVAGKIAKLAPDLTEEQRDRVGAVVVEVLEILARDELPRVRRILSEELKTARGVPPGVIERLAHDEHIEVSGPVLEHSPLLSDTVLVEIIQSDPVRGALAAISNRDGLRQAVSEAVAATRDEDAITMLLSNKSAQIREETLDELIDRAPSVNRWHMPLVTRPVLSARAITQLSTFVADSLLDALCSRKDNDTKTAQAVSQNVHKRLQHEQPTGGVGGAAADGGGEDPDNRAKRMHDDGTLTGEAVMSAMGKGDRAFVTAALALMAELPQASVQRAVSLASAKGITAIAWKAELTMADAVQLQLRLSRIAPAKVLKARADGGYPMSNDDMEWQLEFFGS